MAHEILTPEQRAVLVVGTVEQRLQALGCPAGLAKRAQQLHETRSAAPRKPAVTKPTVLSETTRDYERQRLAAVIALDIDADRRAGLID
jgi:hypothetical protein